jgi:anti-sigma-K factor RskA
MKELEKEKMLDLLIVKATFGLSEQEAKELKELEREFPELKNELSESSQSFELTAAAISMANLNASESLPSHLQTKILADAEQFFASAKTESSGSEASETTEEEYQKTFAFEPKRPGWSWLGWTVAALACIALAINLWTTRLQKPTEIVGTNPTPTVTPLTPELTLTQKREQLLASAADKIQTNWAEAKPSGNEISGDVVWSSQKQEGYIRFRGLPVNDPNKETYQLWIVDENQDEKTPVDGGVFDVNERGEVIIPINAKLKVQKPKMFAVTVEKPGGVVVSKLGKVVAIAKV